MSANLGTIICLCDDVVYARWVVESVRDAGPVTALISKKGWDRAPADYKMAMSIMKSLGAKCLVGDYDDEHDQRNAVVEEGVAQKLDRVICPDTDEPLSPRLLQTLLGLGREGIGDRVYCSMETMWYSPEYRIVPPERLTPLIMFNPQVVKHVSHRHFTGGSEIVLGPEHGLLLHLSYCQPDGSNRIEVKTRRSTHAPEFRPEWKKIWSAWPASRTVIRNIHPTHAGAFYMTERRPVPDQLVDIPLPTRPPIPVPDHWPRISAVIPLYGHPELVHRLCASLLRCRDLFQEIIFVDDASIDSAAAAVEEEIAKWKKLGNGCQIRLIRNKINRGFAFTSNRGIEAATGELIALINSDVVITRAGLIRLVETLRSSATVAAAGPMTNHASQHQMMEPTYTSLENLELFAEDQALFGQDDRLVDMLVGFYMLIRRSAIEEVGLFDEDTFETGNFEDNDWCARARIQGFSLMVSGRSYAHHDASASISTREEHPALLLARNERKYIAKYKDEIECGYMSGLPGLTNGEPVHFDHARKPSNIIKELKRLAPIAKISLGIICKDEERVIADLLRCVTRGGFHEIIVVDTGSSDRTIEKCREFGIEPIVIPMEESFSKSRNECIKRATGDWFMYLDCDDTISLLSLLRCVEAAINAPPHIGGFMIPIQFVGGIDGDTVVDHPRLFRLLPGIEFHLRIHEQIYDSIRSRGGEIPTLGGVVVLHSGYDNSPDGQKKKRERDWPKLWLDHEENPGAPFPMWNIGMTYARTGEFEEAIPWLRKCISACPPHVTVLRGAYSLLGQSLSKSGHSDEAVAAFEEGLAAVGEDPEIRFMFARHLSGVGRHFEAKEQYELIQPVPGLNCVSTDSGILGPKRLHNLASEHLALGDYRNARDTWRRCIAEYNSGPSATSLAFAALEMGDIRTAREAHGAMLGIIGPSPEWVNVGLQICDQTDNDKESFLRSVLERRPYAIPVLEGLVDLLISQGRENEAEASLIELDRLGSVGGTTLLAIRLVRTARYEEALTKWESVLARDPNHESAQAQIAALKQTLGRPAPEADAK